MANEVPERCCLILTKASCARPDVAAAVEAVRKAGADLSVRVPFDLDDMAMFIRDAMAGGATRIIAGGGDGTLNATVTILMAEGLADRLSLGVLPLGTANDFARGAALPLDDLDAALTRAVFGPATAIDIGAADGRCFINVASGGFGAEVTATTPRELKDKLGGAAYTLAGFVKARDFKPYRIRLTLPDGTVEESAMAAMAVGNNRYAGGGYDVAPKASLTDGLLDLLLLSSAGPGDLSQIIAEMADPQNPDNRLISYRQLSRCVIESERPLHVNLDGEPISDHRFAFSVHPLALHVVLGTDG